MNEQMNINVFHELVNSDLEKGSLLDILRGLTEINDPSDFNTKVSPKPLGAWSGWAF